MLATTPPMLEFVSECCKTQTMCVKFAGTDSFAIKFVLECCKTHEMCNEGVNICFFVFDSIPEWCKTHEMCDRIVSEDPFCHSILLF